MSKPAEGVSPQGASPRSLGFVSGLMAKALGAMSPAERKDFVADAAAISASELAKAGEHAINMGEGSNTIGVIEDQWSGAPDDGLTFHRAGGPGTETPSGDVSIGKPQEASGAGAARMEREYSRYARQSGVEEATNRLGRELSKARQAIKALVNFGESMSQRMTALESTALSTVPTEPVAKADFDKAIAKAVANMLPDMVRMTAGAVGAALIKSEDESGEEDEEEGEDEEAKEAESGSGTEIEIVNEMDEEDEAESDDDEKAAAKAAARSRLVAKSLYLLAKRSIRKAKMAEEDKDKKKAMAECRKARVRLAKAVLHLEIAKAVRGNGKPGPSTLGLAKALAKAANEIKPQSINQNKWPATSKDEVGKGGSSAQIADTAAKSLENQIAEIRKAVEGNGMLTARIEQLMDAIARQPAPGSDNLPPVFALAKAKPDQLASVEGSINQMAAENKISLDEADRALNVVGLARRGIPTADAMLGTLPLVVQETIKQRLAA